MAAEITEADWLSELARLSSHQGEGMTVEEMAKQHGVGIRKMQGLMREAAKLGWVAMDYRTATTFNGLPFRQRVYVVRKPK